MIIYSPAKINLFLKVVKRRDDGYHDIVTIMQPVSIYDEISLRATDGQGIAIACDNRTIPLDSTNIAYKAADAFLGYTGLKIHISINLKKKIPAAGGLGGGSSNAASVLMCLNEITNTKLSREELMTIGAKLGSDVPFFMHRGSAIATGRGDNIEAIELPKFWYIIINPLFPVSTAWVYGNLHLTKKQEDINIFALKKQIRAVSVLNIKDILENDLEVVTSEKYHEIRDIKALLKDLGAKGALMSGSGPTVFGVFENKKLAESAYNCIKKELKFKEMAVFVVQGIENKIKSQKPK